MPSSNAPALSDLIAHSAPDDGGDPQPLEDHLRGVADRAARFAEAFDSQDFARWLGWWHDAGKVHPDFQDYIAAPAEQARGPDHSSIGMLRAMATFEPLAFNVAGHHGGLTDRDDLKARTKRKRKEARITDALAQAVPLLERRVKTPSPAALPDFIQNQNSKEQTRRLAFWLRMLHSALVDADCLDTEAHFNPRQARLRNAGEQEITPALWETFQENQRELVAGAKATAVNEARAHIYDACLDAAKWEPGVFSLTVPTGGGKTRSAMAFALRHALRFDKRRVVVALPYTSIIEQNAAVYREIFGSEAVLEHHSAAGANDAAGRESERERQRRLAAENWNAPLVVTTTVQLLESLFTNQNRRVRKLHRLAGSVIILDEVQTLPPKLLRTTLDALRELVRAYDVTLLLCTATQPALKARPDFADGLDDVREIIPEPQKLYATLQRVTYEVREEPMSWSETATLMQQAAASAGPPEQALAVCNTVADAQALLGALPDAEHVFHLSARMCKAHRRVVLKAVRRRLKEGEPVLLVSTQVVEAGVDIDFPVVLRAFGPFDRIVQAAGRCNREGRRETGRVIVFRPTDGGLPPDAYRAGADETNILWKEAETLNFHDPAVSLTYFRRLYGVLDLDKGGLQQKREGFLFEQVGRQYRLIDDASVPVVVPYPNEDALDELLRPLRFKECASLADWRALRPFTVNLRAWAHRKAQKENLCREVAPDLWKWDGAYDARGLTWDDPAVSEDLVW